MRQKTALFMINLPALVQAKLERALRTMDRLSEKRLSAIGRVQALADLVITLAKGGTIPDWKKAPPTLREAIVYDAGPFHPAYRLGSFDRRGLDRDGGRRHLRAARCRR